jgi:capsular exopolysaccharide synthesis family protein
MTAEPAKIGMESHAPSHSSAAEALHEVLRFIRIVRYRTGFVVTSLVVAGLLGALYYATATRIFQANAAVLVSQSGSDVWNASMAGDEMRDSLIPTYEKLFSSPVVLEAAVAKLSTLPAAARVDLQHLPRDKWADGLVKNFTARNTRRTNIIELTYRSKSHEAAEAVLDAILSSYAEFMEKTYRDVSTEIHGLLHVKLNENQKEVDRAQQELLAIKRQIGIVIRDKDTYIHPIVQRVMEINLAKLEVQKQRIELEATIQSVYDAVQQGRDLRQYLMQMDPTVGRELLLSGFGLNPQFAEVVGKVEQELMQNRAELQTKSNYYGPTHPEIHELREKVAGSERYLLEYRAKVNQRLNGIRDVELAPMLISMIEERLAKARSHEAQLDTAYDQFAAAAMQLNNRLVELQIAEDKVQRLRSFQDLLQDRIKNIDLRSNRLDVQVQIVGEPEASNKPVTPRLKIVGLLCLAGGLAFGCGLAYVLDLLDDRFRSPEELRDQLGVPVLAMIRDLEVQSESGADALHVHVVPRSVQSESFRTLRTTLAFSGHDLHRIAVTSSEPGDGKTTVLSNLAVSYAQAGKRVLIIDADMRKPGLSRLFAMRGIGGISDVLRSDQEIAAMCQERVRPSGVPNLELIPCGPKPSNPAELLTSSRLADLIAWAETHYDQVLIDCPPVMAAADAAIIGRAVDGMLLVVQPARNHRRLVLRAAESLVGLGVNLLGVVANRVGDEKERGYYGYGGYGYGYGYGYGDENAYGHEDEDHTDHSAEEADEDAPTNPRHGATVPLPSRSTRPRRAA